MAYRESDRAPDVVRRTNQILRRRLARESDGQAKKKRVKYVHKDQMVAHLWAHQLQASARVAHGNFYFDGPTIYSYGSHFPIATHIPKKGKKPACILFTTGRYSSTTRGHISLTRGAIPPGPQIFEVKDVWADNGRYTGLGHGDNFRDYRRRMDEAVAACLTSRTRGRELFNLAIGLEEEGNRYAERFGLKSRLKIDVEHVLSMQESANKSDERAAARERKNEEKYRAMREQTARENAMGREERVAAWRAGESVRLKDGDFPMQGLRVRGSRIETTLGIVIEIESCKPLLARIRELSQALCPTPRELGPVGNWGMAELLSSVEPQIVTVGCHEIAVPEIERIAKELNL